jgi:hypothetical protein
MGSKKALFDKRKFILSIGDEGAILALMNGKSLEERHFIISPDTDELSKILEINPTVPLYLLVDVLDQAYIQHTLPPVSALNIGQLVKRRLEKDFADEDIKEARRLYREKDGRKDWNYSFVSVHNAPPFSEWLEVATAANNPFKGIYLLPIESENFIKLLSESREKKKQTEWQILVSHNKVGGFRQIVYKDGKVIFTRIAQPIGGQAPDVTAGNIEQETLNTIEYVRRLGFDDDEKLDIYIIVSRSVKAALETNALRAGKIILLTPDEVAEKIGLSGVAEKTDRFGDIVLSASFANSKPVLRLSSPYTKKIEQISQLQLTANAIVALVVPLLILLSIMSISDIFALENKIYTEQTRKNKIKSELDIIKSQSEDLPENSDNVVEIIKIHDSLLSNMYMPLDFLEKFSEIKTSLFSVQNASITIDESFEGKDIIKAKLSISFSSTNKDIDRLVEDQDAFTQEVRNKFDNYNVGFSKLSGQSDVISLETSESSNSEKFNTIDITIEGPKENMAPQRGRGRRRR